MTRMFWRLVLGVLMSISLGLAAMAETPKGLMWNRSGLPAVFPLLLKTDPGRDYVVVLSDSETDAPVLSAYAVGGEAFRVLVPPGTYQVRIRFGTEWDGEAERFVPNAKSGSHLISGHLTFRVEGLGTKTGHLIDLRGLHDADQPKERMAEYHLCQSLRVALRRSASPLDRTAFDRAWLDRGRGILPDAAQLPSENLREFPRFHAEPRTNLANRNLGYLRYQNDQAPFGIMRPRERTILSQDLLKRPCY